MTAAEHYAAAERLLLDLADAQRGSGAEASLLAEAAVHATLALAATVREMASAVRRPAEIIGGASVMAS